MSKLKIGLLVDNENIPVWAYEMIKIIKDSDHSKIELIIQRGTEQSKSKKLLFDKIKHLYKTFFWRLINLLDNYLNPISNNAFAKKKLSELLNIDIIKADVIQTTYSDYFSSESIEKIKKYQLDILIRLGFRIIRGEILNIPKYGIWSYHHGDSSINRGGPPAVWEVLRGISTTGATLQILSEELDGGLVISKTYSSTEKYSIIKNKNKLYWKALYMIPRKLKQLHEQGDKIFFENINKINKDFVLYSNDLLKDPNNFSNIKFLIKKTKQKIYSKIQDIFFFNQWVIMFNINPVSKVSKSIYKFKTILPPKDRFWADPFVIEKNKIFYIYFEEFLFGEEKGKISLITIDKNGLYSKPKVVLEEKHHLSYPFIIKDNNSLFMIPETKEKKSIDIYECKKFPTEWNFKKTLISKISAVDPTILKYNEKYWLFCNIAENDNYSNDDELHIFYSDNLLGDNWISHPMNPVVSDVRSSRPAGRVFEYNGNLYRPSQDCSQHYGFSTKFNKIIKLDEKNYSEKVTEFMSPDWSDEVISTHTFNHAGKLTVIDAQIKRSKYF